MTKFTKFDVVPAPTVQEVRDLRHINPSWNLAECLDFLRIKNSNEYFTELENRVSRLERLEQQAFVDRISVTPTVCDGSVLEKGCKYILEVIDNELSYKTISTRDTKAAYNQVRRMIVKALDNYNPNWANKDDYI